jgi:hypothetical protein
MKEQIKIYLSTCNKTSHILSATIFLYKKFITDLKPKFKILGFNKPNLSDWKDVEFISLSSSLQNISNWSLYIYNYFKTIDDKFIFFALDDFFPIDYFNKNVYDFVLNYMDNNSVGFCVLDQEPAGNIERNELDKIIEETDNMFIYRRKKNVNYQLVLQPGLWNREYFCKMFSISASPWEFELRTTQLANSNNNSYNISTSKYPGYDNCIFPFSTQSSLSSKWNGISVLGLKHDIVLELIENNLLHNDKILIGAWDNYILFDINRKISKDEFLKLCKNDYKSWKNLYLKYY